jgi:hypothetical protein
MRKRSATTRHRPRSASTHSTSCRAGSIATPPTGDPGGPDEIAKGVVTVADGDVAQVMQFCARWGLAVQRTARGDGRWAVLIIEGRALPVRGFTEVTAMYRR